MWRACDDQNIDKYPKKMVIGHVLFGYVILVVDQGGRWPWSHGCWPWPSGLLVTWSLASSKLYAIVEP
jgi:hypothetical protein